MQKQKDDSHEIRYVTFRQEREEFAPPAPGTPINSPFNTIENWLTAICEGEHPKLPIETFQFGAFEGDEWLIFCVGENSYQKDQGTTAIRIDFKPSHMYFLLPEEDYMGKCSQLVRDNIFRQLEQFSRTEKFQSSFLSQAVSAEFNGNMFWLR